MRPLKLTLKNFIGIRNGLGRDEITIDVADKVGLVALVGPNGCGKTTILDSLHPYRLMPFRAGGYSPRSFSYYEETYGDAGKELVWEHGGERYRSEILIKGSIKTKKTEAYLYVETPDGWLPLRLPDNTASDGKTETYDRCVNHVLGTPEMFFTAVFSAQGRKQLSDYPAGEIKGLLSELLGLDHLLLLSQQADDAAKHQQARFSGMQAALQRYDAAAADVADAQTRITDGETRLSDAQQRRAKARVEAQQASQQYAEISAKAANIDELRTRHRRLDDASRAAKAEHIDRTQRWETETARVKREGAGGSIQADIAQIDQQRLRLQTRQRALDAQRAAAPDAGAAREMVNRLEGAVSADDSAVTAARAQVDTLRAAAGEVRVIEAQLQSAANDGRTMKADADRSVQQAKLASEVPCAGMDINATCPLLKAAHAAAAQGQELQGKLAAARTRYSELAAKRDEIAQRCAGLQDAEAALTAAQDQLKKSQANLREWQAKVAAAAASEAAAGEIAAIGEDLERLDAQRKAKDDELQRAAADAEARLKDLGAQLIKINDDYAAKRAEIDRDRADLPPVTEAGVDLSGAQRELEAANTQLDAAESDIADLTNRLATLRARLAQVQEQMRGAEVARQEAAALTDDIAQWRLLAKALGRDGVVALSIDDAGPTISGIANDLLLSCYGPRFSIRFDTQAEKKDGSMKETFDIRVFDAERGDDKSVSKMSGGERIYINEALTRAIGLFHAQALGQAYTCLFSDESDGALDPERKQHYMAMKRRVLEIGGYSTEFYITHTPELWEMADSTVDVWGMRVTP